MYVEGVIRARISPGDLPSPGNMISISQPNDFATSLRSSIDEMVEFNQSTRSGCPIALPVSLSVLSVCSRSCAATEYAAEPLLMSRSLQCAVRSQHLGLLVVAGILFPIIIRLYQSLNCF